MQSKYDSLVDEVELIEANRKYAYIRFPNGREDTHYTIRLLEATHLKSPHYVISHRATLRHLEVSQYYLASGNNLTSPGISQH